MPPRKRSLPTTQQNTLHNYWGPQDGQQGTSHSAVSSSIQGPEQRWDGSDSDDDDVVARKGGTPAALKSQLSPAAFETVDLDSIVSIFEGDRTDGGPGYRQQFRTPDSWRKAWHNDVSSNAQQSPAVIFPPSNNAQHHQLGLEDLYNAAVTVISASKFSAYLLKLLGAQARTSFVDSITTYGQSVLDALFNDRGLSCLQTSAPQQVANIGVVYHVLLCNMDPDRTGAHFVGSTFRLTHAIWSGLYRPPVFLPLGTVPGTDHSHAELRNLCKALKSVWTLVLGSYQRLAPLLQRRAAYFPDAHLLGLNSSSRLRVARWRDGWRLGEMSTRTNPSLAPALQEDKSREDAVFCVILAAACYNAQRTRLLLNGTFDLQLIPEHKFCGNWKACNFFDIRVGWPQVQILQAWLGFDAEDRGTCRSKEELIMVSKAHLLGPDCEAAYKEDLLYMAGLKEQITLGGFKLFITGLNGNVNFKTLVVNAMPAMEKLR
ncbi:hypothetical protein CBOM_00854 [Ceraceosorus bombacis]|uniref:Uncharacterized protein n=1 Tax=Ceraceosorus bombacis TaxID=401625 RepID=A0A0P1BBS4_9BASI|nr:hypothetical protein CBOM_00854 [Ceraceosorus bombacis]